jgi:hypothetical protein
MKLQPWNIPIQIWTKHLPNVGQVLEMSPAVTKLYVTSALRVTAPCFKSFWHSLPIPSGLTVLEITIQSNDSLMVLHKFQSTVFIFHLVPEHLLHVVHEFRANTTSRKHSDCVPTAILCFRNCSLHKHMTCSQWTLNTNYYYLKIQNFTNNLMCGIWSSHSSVTEDSSLLKNEAVVLMLNCLTLEDESSMTA